MGGGEAQQVNREYDIFADGEGGGKSENAFFSHFTNGQKDDRTERQLEEGSKVGRTNRRVRRQGLL